MSTLRQQALGIINVCTTALGGEGKEQRQAVDNQTIAIAQAILAQAKAELPHDKILAAASLEPPITLWTSVLTAMEIVNSSLPAEEAKSLADRIEAARKRVGAVREANRSGSSS